MIDLLTDPQALTDFLSTSLRLSIPIIFAAVGGVISERSGVFNIALEGCILGGAFGAAVGAYLIGHPVGGLLLGVFVAMMAGLILAGLAVGLAINQLVAGIAINILMLGLTSYLARLILGADATSTLPGFGPIAIPGLSAIPVLGPVLFEQDLLTYLMYLLVPLSWWVIYKTPWGLNLRAIGDYPVAADSAGISVPKVRLFAVLASCAMAGLGGCYLVLSQVFVFTEHMSAGKGFIALAALILGRWNPIGALLACLFFGLSDAMQLRLQFNSPDVPYQLFSMVPFLASFLALVVFAGKVRPPAAIGIRYERGGK
ncbi:branched-chain amino acid ABC transporter permease [Ruegeria marisrubri]|uniref:Branched-chain amino acid ABC transporter permease n=1 Tax=Ruegeria marisrubri TaxID=1685379 RepID=A0A0X3UDP1_9RHOB|nr:ABC transporter permease [Ruegeria marisrubri]KUJ85311.1 branched-chain amino acid ABC transporter permease [Ruegeria marisrubri]